MKHKFFKRCLPCCSPLSRVLRAGLVLGAELLGSGPLTTANGVLYSRFDLRLLLVLFVIRVAGMDSMGRPYLAPRTPFRVHNPDLAIRAPVFRQRLRSWLADSFHMLRARGPMRRFEKGGRK